MSTAEPSSIRSVLALYPFNLLLGARLLANSATWMQRTSVAWLAYELTGSATFLGLVTFLAFAPAMVLALVGGVLSDRGAPVRILRASRLATVLLQVALAAATLLGAVGPLGLAVAVFLTGCAEGIQGGANKALLWHMVPRRLVSTAIPLTSAVINMSSILGPVVGGLLIALFSAGVAFAAVAIAHACFLGVLYLIPAGLGRAEAPSERFGLAGDVAPLLRYLRGDVTLAAALGLQFLVSFTLKPMIQLLAGLNVGLGGTAQSLGYLTGAYGIGAIVSSLAFAAFGSRYAADWRALFVASTLGGAAFAGAGFTDSLGPTMACILGAGATAVIRIATLQTIIQFRVEPAFRGRTMAVYIALGDAGVAFGALAFGVVAGLVGFPATYVLAGAATTCIGVAGFAVLASSRRP